MSSFPFLTELIPQARMVLQHISIPLPTLQILVAETLLFHVANTQVAKMSDIMSQSWLGGRDF